MNAKTPSVLMEALASPVPALVRMDTTGSIVRIQQKVMIAFREHVSTFPSMPIILPTHSAWITAKKTMTALALPFMVPRIAIGGMCLSVRHIAAPLDFHTMGLKQGFAIQRVWLQRMLVTAPLFLVLERKVVVAPVDTIA